jgi:eukaryotic-like serine/threonine-protein kinase
MQIISRNIYQYQPLWDKWQVDDLIGQGVFGQVYRISYEEYGLTYTSAVKMISITGDNQYSEIEPSICNAECTLQRHSQELVQNLVNEVNILYSLSGFSNILGYHDHKIIQHEDKTSWDILIRMEYAKPLSIYLTEKRMNMDEVITLGIDMCTALEICHRHGIIHRDIKDENIFISEDGAFKLGDFGIAMKLSQSVRTAAMRGTPNFMAPEVYHGKKYNASVDIYSLGIVLYRLLNHGRMPFMPLYPKPIYSDDNHEPLEKRMRGEPFQNPDQTDDALARVIKKACAFEAKDRYTSPIKMKKDLEKVLSNLSDFSRSKLVTMLETKNPLSEQTEKLTLLANQKKIKSIQCISFAPDCEAMTWTRKETERAQMLKAKESTVQID